MSAARPLRETSPEPRRTRLRSVEPTPNTTKKKRSSTGRRRGGWVGLGVVMLVMLVVIGAAAVQTLIIQTKVSIDEVQRELDDARAIEADLLLEVASLEAPARILLEASAKVAMAPPSDRIFLAPIVPGSLEDPIAPPDTDPFPRSEDAS